MLHILVICTVKKYKRINFYFLLILKLPCFSLSRQIFLYLLKKKNCHDILNFWFANILSGLTAEMFTLLVLRRPQYVKCRSGWIGKSKAIFERVPKSYTLKNFTLCHILLRTWPYNSFRNTFFLFLVIFTRLNLIKFFYIFITIFLL